MRGKGRWGGGKMSGKMRRAKGKRGRAARRERKLRSDEYQAGKRLCWGMQGPKVSADSPASPASL